MERKRFAGIEVAPDLYKRNFFFLYLNTLLVGILLVMPGIIQPPFLKDIIKVSDTFFGSINGAMQSVGQVAMLLFIGAMGVLSDRKGRKPLAVIGFGVLTVFYLLFLYSNSIASLLGIPAGFSAALCAALSFSSAKDAFLPCETHRGSRAEYRTANSRCEVSRRWCRRSVRPARPIHRHNRRGLCSTF